MRKKTTTTLFLIVFSIMPIVAVDNYLNMNLEYSYDTNVFSDPLPQFDPTYEWMTWREANPFIKKHNLGFNLSYDIYPKDESRTGFSMAISTKFPIAAKCYTPRADFPELGYHSGWDYIETDETENQSIAFFGSLGPVFRARFGFADLGVAIRLSLGVYTFEQYELILGLQAEPYVNVFIGNNMYLSIKFTYDGHLMRFISDENKIFDPYYQMLTLAPSIGIGIKF